MEVYRTPDDRFAGLPGYDFRPRYFEMYGMVDGGASLRMHYLEEGTLRGARSCSFTASPPGRSSTAR